VGEYQSMAVPVSDGNYLTKALIYYLRLNNIRVTLDPAQANVILTVMVDVFGILRTRTDVLIHNTEKVRAKTTIEMAAFDPRGRIILAPVQGSYEAIYEEKYIAWIGPYIRQQYSQKGQSLLVDFSENSLPERREW
jgi:hypothetical protein